MTDQALATQDRDALLAQYGTDDEVVSLAERIKKTFPGGDKLSDFQLVAFAQYCRVTDVNPWRGEAYPMVDNRGQFHVVDGYKALVRWAKRQAPYSERYRPLTDEIGAGSIGYCCSILREDALPTFNALCDAGIPASEALEIASTTSIGVVTKREMANYPPTGWTWDERARTRALKNALNKSHGAPSPKELAEGSWMVNGTKTVPDDWKLSTPGMPAYEREAIAEGVAQHRQAHVSAQAAMDAGKTAQDAIDEMFGDEPGQRAPPLGHDSEMIEGDFRGAPMDADAHDDLKEDQETIADSVPTAQRTWPSETVDALVGAHLVENPAHAVRVLNLSRILRTTDDVRDVTEWVTRYRGLRDSDTSDPADAAKIADQQMREI